MILCEKFFSAKLSIANLINEAIQEYCSPSYVYYFLVTF